MILQKLINPLKDMRIILFFVIFYIFFTASSKISLIPTGDEIHRIIQSHSLAYDLDIFEAMKKYFYKLIDLNSRENISFNKLLKKLF